MAFISTGTTLTIETAGDTNVFTCNCLSLTANASRANVPTSTMGTTDANGTNSIGATFLPGKLVDRNVECEIDFDPTLTSYTLGANTLFEVGDPSGKEVLITWSTPTTDAWTVIGFITDLTVNATLDERVTASLTIQCSGTTTAGW